MKLHKFNICGRVYHTMLYRDLISLILIPMKIFGITPFFVLMKQKLIEIYFVFVMNYWENKISLCRALCTLSI